MFDLSAYQPDWVTTYEGHIYLALPLIAVAITVPGLILTPLFLYMMFWGINTLRKQVRDEV